MLLQFICSGVGGMMAVLYGVMCVRTYGIRSKNVNVVRLYVRP